MVSSLLRPTVNILTIIPPSCFVLATFFFQNETGNVAQEQSAMGLLLEAMRSAVGSLLEQSVEWGRIEAAHQERRTAMRTNKVSQTLFVV